MCGGVEAREADRVWRIYFPHPKADIPVQLDDSGQLDWFPWGVRTVSKHSELVLQGASPIRRSDLSKTGRVPCCVYDLITGFGALPAPVCTIKSK